MPTVDLTRIGSNIGAMYSLQSLLDINNKLADTQTRLSTGKRINSAADDPAGLTIATKMQARSEGLAVVGDNISDAKNMLSVAEGALSKLTGIMVDMRSKAAQAASDTLGATERQTIQSQLSSFAAQIDDIINETKWNGVQLLDGNISKTFQTGVDEGETTTWSLSQNHDATTLGVSEQVTTASMTEVGHTGSAFSSIGITTSFTGLTGIKTGRYSLEVLDKAAALTSKVNLSTGSTYTGGITGSAGSSDAGTGVDVLGSGNYSFEITGGSSLTDRSNVNWRIVDSDGTVVSSKVGDDLSAATVDLSHNGAGAGNELGLKVSFGGGVAVGSNFSFEFIADNEAKYELTDAGGAAVTIDQDGSAGGDTGDYGFYDMAATTVDTGVGLTFTAAVPGSTTVGDNWTTDYKEAGNYVVDVSTSSKAGAYMTTIDNALDIVNQSMADLGSLMARMTIKEDAASTARLNVESAYNRIMNANMAEEQVEASKYMVLQQTAVAMLAQANQAPQFLLSLFQ